MPKSHLLPQRPREQMYRRLRVCGLQKLGYDSVASLRHLATLVLQPGPHKTAGGILRKVSSLARYSEASSALVYFSQDIT